MIPDKLKYYKAIFLEWNHFIDLLESISNEHFRFAEMLLEENDLCVMFNVKKNNLSETTSYVKELLKDTEYPDKDKLLSTEDFMLFLCDEYEYILDSKINLQNNKNDISSSIYLDNKSLHAIASYLLSRDYNINEQIFKIKHLDGYIAIFFT